VTTAALAPRLGPAAEAFPAPARDEATTTGEVAARGLAVRYGEQAPVFSGVGFSIGAGETVALIGRNGAGKSTLLRCFLGFVQPATGEVELFGERLAATRRGSLRRLRGRIGFVAQKHNLVARLSALSNVVHGRLAERPGPRQWLHGIAPRAIREEALAALDRVGLADMAMRRSGTLSGGQSQRVAIARALVGRPRLILADEPAASLDPTAGEVVLATFAEVARGSGTTLVFTTHNMEHALRYAGRVLGLRNGGLALDAPTARLSAGTLRDLFD
jgi:phosphonate transport system ATP-binding protein